MGSGVAVSFVRGGGSIFYAGDSVFCLGDSIFYPGGGGGGGGSIIILSTEYLGFGYFIPSANCP